MNHAHTSLARRMSATSGVVLATAVVALGLALAAARPAHAAPNAKSALDELLGSWKGTGTMRLNDGTTERLVCNTYYTGGGSQFGMVIRCTGDNNRKIEVRSKLSDNHGQLTGRWEERTYNATGTVVGKVSARKVDLNITGDGLTGHMAVSYNGNRQNVAINVDGIALKSVNVTLGRQY